MDTPGITTVYMAENDNGRHQDLLKSLYQSNASLDPGSPSTSRSEVECPPIDANDFVEDPITGRRIYRRDAIAALCRYLDYLSGRMSSEEVAAARMYRRRSSRNGEDVVQLTIPLNDDLPKPLHALAGHPSHEITADACFAICKDLVNQGYLESCLFATDVPSQHSVCGTDNLKTAGQSVNTRCYPRKRPSFWTRVLQRSLDRLYPLAVTVGTFRDGPHAPMLIMSRLPWPRMDALSVFSNGQEATVRVTPGSPISVGEIKQQQLVAYTMRIVRAVANKPLECKPEDLLYLYAPLKSTWDSAILESLAPWQLLDVETCIAWDQIEAAADHWAHPLVPSERLFEEGDVDDAVIQDRAVEFTNRHFVTKLRRDLTPLSKPDAESVCSLVHVLSTEANRT